MSFDSLGLSEPMVRAVTELRLHHSHSHPDSGDSRRPGRRRPAGRRTDRHRQDRRLHAADPAAPARAPGAAARRAPGARADPDADPRTRGAGRGKRARLWQVPEADVDRDLRRRRHQSADQAACAVASISSSPRRAACSTTCSSAPSTCRNSKSSCSTKPTACSTWASSTTSSRVLAALPPKRQNLLFSATFSDEIKTLADGLLDSPAMIEVARRNSTVEVIAQKIHPVDRDRKHALLAHLIKTARLAPGAGLHAHQARRQPPGRAVGQGRHLRLAIHGNKSQSARTRALAEFKDGTLQVLVATDIAARGIDIDQLPHVVNYDLPNVPGRLRASHRPHRPRRRQLAKRFRWYASMSTTCSRTSKS